MRNGMKWQYVRANDYFFFVRFLAIPSRHRRSKKRCRRSRREKERNCYKNEELCRNDNEKRERNLKWAECGDLATCGKNSPLNNIVDKSFAAVNWLNARFISVVIFSVATILFFSFSLLSPLRSLLQFPFLWLRFFYVVAVQLHTAAQHHAYSMIDRTIFLPFVRPIFPSAQTHSISSWFFVACFSVFFNFSILFPLFLPVGTQFQPLNKNR